jgi:hypothetical protein
MKRPWLGWCLLGFASAQADLMESNAFMRVQPGNFSCQVCQATGDANRLRLEAKGLSATYTLLRPGKLGLRSSGGETRLNRKRLTQPCQSLSVKSGDTLEFKRSRDVILEMPHGTICK